MCNVVEKRMDRLEQQLEELKKLTISHNRSHSGRPDNVDHTEDRGETRRRMEKWPVMIWKNEWVPTLLAWVVTHRETLGAGNCRFRYHHMFTTIHEPTRSWHSISWSKSTSTRTNNTHKTHACNNIAWCSLSATKGLYLCRPHSFKNTKLH